MSKLIEQGTCPECEADVVQVTDRGEIRRYDICQPNQLHLCDEIRLAKEKEKKDER